MGTSATVPCPAAGRADLVGATTPPAIGVPSMRNGSAACSVPRRGTGDEPGWKASNIWAIGVTPAIGVLAKGQA